MAVNASNDITSELEKLHTSPPSKQENYSQSLQTLDLKHLAL